MEETQNNISNTSSTGSRVGPILTCDYHWCTYSIQVLRELYDAVFGVQDSVQEGHFFRADF